MFRKFIFISALMVVASNAQADPTFSSQSFTGLQDAPSSYLGETGKCVKVNGTETGVEFGACGAGDVTAVGDCASGDCYDGSSDGGTYARLYDGDSHYGAFITANLSANRNYTFGNLALTFDQSVASGATPTFTGTNITAVATGDSATSFFSSGTLEVGIGGTGATSLTDGGVLLGSGTGAITPMAVLGNGEIIVGDGTTDPVALAAFTSSAGTLKHESGGLEGDVSAYDGLIGITGGAVYNQTGTNAQIIIFDGSGAPTSAAISSDATMTNAGVLTIADNAVDGTDIALASEAAGDIMYSDGTNWVRLAKGSAGQVLEMNAGATAPEWDTDDSGAGTTKWNEIADADGAGTVDFAGNDQDITSSEDGGDILTITNTDADQTSDSIVLRLATNDTNDANSVFLRGTSDEDGTPLTEFNVAMTGTAGGLTMTMGNTGVVVTTDGDGAITFLGASAGADEDLTLNLDDTSDHIVFSTSTSATDVDWTSLDMTIGGNDMTLGSSTAGFKFTSDGDGAITFKGLGDGSSEDLTFNLDDTSNTARASTSTSLNLVDFATNSIGVSVVTEAYDDAGWNGDLTVPTKDAVRDKLESGLGDITTVGDVASGAAFDGTAGTTLTGATSGLALTAVTNSGGTGYAVTMTGGASSNSGSAGGTVTVSGGAGNGAGAGGAVTLRGGAGGATGNGGAITVSGRTPTGGDTNGGAATLSSGGSNAAGASGNVTISVGNGTSTMSDTGDILISSGDGHSSASVAGGNITLEAGDAGGGAASAGGEVTITGGFGGASGGAGGTVTIRTGGGNTGNSAGGALTVDTGDGTGSSAGGAANFTSGNGGATGAGGALNVTSGNAGATGPAAGGAINVTVGDTKGTDQAGANLTLKSGRGTGTGAGGSIIFQTAAAGGSGSSNNSLATVMTLASTGTAVFAGNDMGWSVVDQTDNQACTAGCTNACVLGIANATGTAVTNLVSCSDATADLCVCAGSS